MINTPANLLKFLNAARNLAKQGLKEKDILAFAKQEFGEVTDLVRLQINKIFKTKNQPSVGIKTKDPIFDNTVETIPFDDTGTPFNPKDPQKVYGKPKVNQNRDMTPDELEDFADEIGENIEAYDFDGTVNDAKRIIKDIKDYEADMFAQYKMGKLDPVAGDKSPARKKFLEKKLEDAELSGDNRLITQDEVEELSSFDLGTKMDKAKLSTNDEIKKAVDEIMSDTSPAALQKSIEVDNLMLEYPGMSRELAKQIANDPDPARKAQVIAMVEQTIKMGNKGKSGDEIIKLFKSGKTGDETLDNSIILNNFDPKGRKPSAKGGRIKMAKGGLPNILGF